jgi:hypothetical protein
MSLQGLPRRQGVGNRRSEAVIDLQLKQVFDIDMQYWRSMQARCRPDRNSMASGSISQAVKD